VDGSNLSVNLQAKIQTKISEGESILGNDHEVLTLLVDNFRFGSLLQSTGSGRGDCRRRGKRRHGDLKNRFCLMRISCKYK
jgi:hypothetical protein